MMLSTKRTVSNGTSRSGAAQAVSRLAAGLHMALRGLCAAGVKPASSMTQGDLRSTAYGLSYAALASLWQKRNRAVPWHRVYESWESRLPAPGVIDSHLYGAFSPEDKFELLTENGRAFSLRAELFTSSKKSIDVATYYIQADKTSWWMAKLLADCAKRGVRVRVLADGTATARKCFEDPAVAEVVGLMRSAGVEYRFFHDAQRPYNASHRKLLIMDGETLITGGRNFADHYSGNKWRDIDLLLRGPSVFDGRRLFEKSFDAAEGYAEMPFSEPGIFQCTTPEAIFENASFLFLLQCLRASRKSFDIENAYYINHPIIYGHLLQARERGVRVRIFTNSADSNDLDFTNYRVYSGFPDLIAAGIELYLRAGKGRTLHCKYFVADGEWVGFGSSNLDYYSPRFCGEAGLHVRSASLAGMLTEWFNLGISGSDRIEDTRPIESVLANQPVGRWFDRWLRDIQ